MTIRGQLVDDLRRKEGKCRGDRRWRQADLGGHTTDEVASQSGLKPGGRNRLVFALANPRFDDTARSAVRNRSRKPPRPPLFSLVTVRRNSMTSAPERPPSWHVSCSSRTVFSKNAIATATASSAPDDAQRNSNSTPPWPLATPRVIPATKGLCRLQPSCNCGPIRYERNLRPILRVWSEQADPIAKNRRCWLGPAQQPETPE